MINTENDQIVPRQLLGSTQKLCSKIVLNCLRKELMVVSILNNRRMNNQGRYLKLSTVFFLYNTKVIYKSTFDSGILDLI